MISNEQSKDLSLKYTKPQHNVTMDLMIDSQLQDVEDLLS
jgi:hypothetical protein